MVINWSSPSAGHWCYYEVHARGLIYVYTAKYVQEINSEVISFFFNLCMIKKKVDVKSWKLNSSNVLEIYNFIIQKTFFFSIFSNIPIYWNVMTIDIHQDILTLKVETTWILHFQAKMWDCHSNVVFVSLRLQPFLYMLFMSIIFMEPHAWVLHHNIYIYMYIAQVQMYIYKMYLSLVWVSLGLVNCFWDSSLFHLL